MAFLPAAQQPLTASQRRYEQDAVSFNDLMALEAVRTRDYQQVLYLLELMPQIAQRQGEELADRVYAQLRPGQNAGKDQIELLKLLRTYNRLVDADRQLKYIARAEATPAGDAVRVMFPDFCHHLPGEILQHQRYFNAWSANNLREAQGIAKKLLVHEVSVELLRPESLPPHRFRARSGSRNVRYIPTTVTLRDLL